MATKNQYALVSLSDPQDFSEKVNDMINEGWAPLGGVSTCSAPYYDKGENKGMKVFFSQAFIRNSEPN